jgi:metal-sulfur cluster biosynthetic enzyme
MRLPLAAPPSPPRRTRLDRGLSAAVTTHKSGGRDQWSDPLRAAPRDPVEGVRHCLREVLDPEIPISLVDLGLIYGVDFEDGVATVRITYTATACPCMEFIREDVRDRLESERWIERVELVEVWDPPWTVDRISPEGRTRLREIGVSA